MQELAWLLEPLHIWLSGGSWAQIKAAPGFMMLVLLGAALIPSTIIAMGIGATEWRETPLAMWFGLGRPDPREHGWAERARDLDGDGRPDF